jgi:uncharacterized protein YcbK (DUF882 family)
MSTAHFKDIEFKCKCNGCDSPKPSSELLAVLELVRLKFNAPVLVTSGYRCEAHNAKVGGAIHSSHLKANAADIQVKGVPPQKVYDFLEVTFPDSYGLGDARTFTHLDTRVKRARWSY